MLTIINIGTLMKMPLKRRWFSITQKTTSLLLMVSHLTSRAFQLTYLGIVERVWACTNDVGDKMTDLCVYVVLPGSVFCFLGGDCSN